MKEKTPITVSTRTEGMINASADYYRESQLFFYIMNAKARGYDLVDEKLEDLALQLSPLTATWGLSFWEESVGLPKGTGEDYEKRRPPILARLLNYENFSAEMVKRIAKAYGNDVEVDINSKECLVTVTFFNDMPSSLMEMKKDIDRIIHAHLGLGFQVVYRSSVFFCMEHVFTPNIVVVCEELGCVETKFVVGISHVLTPKLIIT